MNHREFAVLDAVNIATTKYRRPKHDYEATAAQIAEVLNNDPRIQEEFGIYMDTPQVGSALGRLAKGPPKRREPLVEKIDTRRWRLTHAGVRVLSA